MFTSLTKEAMPVVRYRTRDLTRLEPGTAYPAFRRMRKVTGRTDDMMIVRGVNVFPSQVEEQLLTVDGLAPHYLCVLEPTGQPRRADGRASRRRPGRPSASRSAGCSPSGSRTGSASLRWSRSSNLVRSSAASARRDASRTAGRAQGPASAHRWPRWSSEVTTSDRVALVLGVVRIDAVRLVLGVLLDAIGHVGRVELLLAAPALDLDRGSCSLGGCVIARTLAARPGRRLTRTRGPRGARR